MNLFNALSNRKELFSPLDSKDVKIYCCGPTVYDVPHLGHARTYIFLDLLQRILRNHMGYGVRTVMNITDLDDKIISKGGLDIARKYEHVFFKTMQLLNIEKPDFTPRVSDFLESAKNLSSKCLDKGFAYSGILDSKNIYFETERYLKQFGEIFTHSSEQSSQNLDKKNPIDFAIWKSKEWTDANNVKQFEMPGWHTECTVMAAKHFGDSIDIHLGGIDLKFPHHENEIALGRVLYGKKNWVRFCLYTGHLQIEGCKMSKSKKNFLTVQDMLAEGFSPLSLRYFLMKYPYYKPINFNKDELKKVQKSYENFMHHFENIKQYLKELENGEKKTSYKEVLLDLNNVKEKIDSCLLDNMNIPDALQVFEDYVRTVSTNKMRLLSYSWLKYIFKYILHVTDRYFGLIQNECNENNADEIFSILKNFRSNVREYALKQNKLLHLCDDVREKMNQLKFVTEDL